MKSKLTKKTKKQDIIFPSHYLGRIPSSPQKDKQIHQSIQSIKKNRILSKSISRQKIRSISKRSLSHNELTKKIKKQNEKVQIKVNVLQKDHVNPNRDGSLLKKKGRKYSSFNAMSKAYYQGMEALLQKQCQTIFKSKYLKKQPKFHIQNLQNNLLFIQSLNNQKKITQETQLKISNNSKLRGNIELNQQSSKILSQESNSNKSSPQIQIQLKPFLKSLQELDLGVNSRINQVLDTYTEQYYQISSRENIHSQKSIKKTQRKRQENLQKNQDKKIWFLTSKFNLKRVQILKINYLQLKNLDHSYQLYIFLQKRSQILYTKLLYKNKKPTQSRYKRRSHIKKLSNKKQRQKSLILSHFQKSNDNNYQLYHNIINYCQQYVHIRQTYKGLILESDIDQIYDTIGQKQKQNKIYYFISKINSTFYLNQIDYSFNQDKPCVKFTYLYDFSSFHCGRGNYQIYYLPQNIQKLHQKRNGHKVIQRLIKQYMIKKEEQNNVGYQMSACGDGSLSGRIGQICPNLIQKWNEDIVTKINNINKQYHMIGNLTNFFKFHNHFDYGFFNQANSYFINHQKMYTLCQTQKYLPLYSYADNYTYLYLSQRQKEALVIPHTPSITNKKQSEVLIHQFLGKAIAKKYKIEHQYYQLFIKQYLIKLKQKAQFLQIIIQNIYNLRSNKIIAPIRLFPTIITQGQPQINYQKTSLIINNYLQKFKLYKSFLYSRYCNRQTPRQIIHYKSIDKIQGNYIFVTLYSIPMHDLIQFKIYIFKLGRQFVIKLDNIQNIDDFQVKELIKHILDLIKGLYLRKFILQQAKKNQKRKIDVLQKFYMQLGGNIPMNLRNKKRIDDNIKRKIMRMATLKSSNESSLVYENIISHYFLNEEMIFYLITIRFMPWQQLKQQNDYLNNKIEICIHKQHTLTYFKYIIKVQQLIQNITYGSLTIKQMDTRYIYTIFIQLKQKIISIIKTSNNKINIIFTKLKQYIKGQYKAQQNNNQEQKYILLQNQFIEIKHKQQQQKINSQISISIQDEITEKRNQIIKKTNYDYYQYNYVNRKLFINLSLVGIKIVKWPVYREIYEQFLIQLVHVTQEKLEDAHQPYRSNRQLWISNMMFGTTMLVLKWEAAFINVISFDEYNKKLIGRLFRSIKRALI